MTYETDRLNALRSLDLLDTPPSESFDRITRMAAQIFGLPIAAVSLTDSDRQWFKSRVGVDHWQIPRETAPCGQVSDSCGFLLIRDFEADPYYKNSYLGQNGIRFYAGAPLTTRDGYTLGAMCVLGTEPRDITDDERRALTDLAAMVMAQIELQHAFGRVDPITGLPNSHQLVEDIQDAARDHAGDERVVVFLDLMPVEQLSDALRVIGPKFLHDMGRSATQKLQQALPNTKLYCIDPIHLGFVLESSKADEIHRIAERVRQNFADAGADGDVRIQFRLTLGMAPFTLGDVKAHDVLRFARSAAQDARDRSKPFAIYSDHLDERYTRRFRLISDMPAALKASDQLELVFQPKVDLKSGACVGAEALLRWTHPQLGSISPAEFIPIVEQSGLARALTDWVLDAALVHISRWEAQGRNLTVSVNISAVNLDEDDFAGRVFLRVANAGIRPKALELEITESALIRNGERAFEQLDAIAGAGIGIAVDDFGTGYSSLSYLKRIPANCVKIDRSFIEAIASEPRDLHLVTSMVVMLKGMNFRVVAEGIETARVQHLLELAGCDEGQGYHLARPMPAAQFESWLIEQTVQQDIAC